MQIRRLKVAAPRFILGRRRCRVSAATIIVGLALCVSASIVADENNAIVTLVPQYPGEYENVKYAITLSDPDGIAQFLVLTSSGSGLFGGEPGCVQSLTGGTVDIGTQEYPVTWTMTDCLGNTVSGEIRCPERQCANPDALLDTLIGQVLAMATPAAQPLVAILRGASKTLVNGNTAATVNQLKAAIHFVNAQEGQDLTTDQANKIRSSLDGILTLLQ